MRMHPYRLLLIVAMLPAALASVRGRAAVLVDSGTPCATIVVGAQPSQQAREAATELQACLQRMSGARIPIVADAASARGARILVGRNASVEEARRLNIELPSGVTRDLDEEGYVVAVDDATVLLAGNETTPYQGTHYAVYDLLHQLGCRWYMPGSFGEVIPTVRTVRVSTQRKRTRPDFRVRNIWYKGWIAISERESAAYALWRRRNRMTSPEMSSEAFMPPASDNTTYRLLPREKYWADHPEYYALNEDGTRNPEMMCMTNPGALDAATETIAQWFHEHPDRLCFDFSPPDAPVLCNCVTCRKAMHGGFGGEGWGAVSDAYFDFVVRLADRAALRCPGKRIASMAYFNRCRPPLSATRKRDNLLMFLASIEQCVLHSYADPNCWSRRAYRAMQAHWGAICGGLLYYEYDPHDWSSLQRPAWRSQGIADDLRLLKANGGWGFDDEGQMAWLSTGLNYYVRARLGWDLREDPQALVKDFAERFFGPAAKPFLRYYESIEQAQAQAKLHRPGNADFWGELNRPALHFLQVWPPSLLEQCAALLD